jgi:aspartate/methionine/tyrosine aminotransferase
MMLPNYMQMHGLARGLGAVVRAWPLVEDDTRWRPDLEALETLVSPATKLILICNPNNPTGSRLTAHELTEICRIASRAGAWIVSDEIYRGAELDSVETPTIWGGYERAIVTSGLSKAFGLPGLRIGWVVGPPALIDELWGVHDYTSIAPGALNDRLARVALARRDYILARTRGIVAANYPLVKKWIERRAPALTHVAPDAGAIVFVRYRQAINSTALVERLRDEQSVLLVPGDHFEMDGYLRIGFGNHPAYLASALELVGEVLDGIA